MKLILESWKKFLNEAEFTDSPDADGPGKKQVIVFDENETYEKDGNTHGAVSHAIKHYAEFEKEAVDAALTQALTKAKTFDNFFLLSRKSGQITASGDQAKKSAAANNNAMLNTFDLINDKIKNNVSLLPEEEQLVGIINNLNSSYQNLVDKYMSSGIDIDQVSEPEKIRQLIDSGKVLKFTGSYSGSEFQYYLNTSNTGLVASQKGKVATLFRIDKRGNDLGKVAGYFSRGVEIKNPAFAQVLGIQQ